MTGGIPIVDSHVHLWDPARLDYPWLTGTELDRPFTAGDLLDAIDDDAIDDDVVGFLVVQADCVPEQGRAEIDWITAQLSDHAGVVGIVAFAPVELGSEVTPFLHILRAMPQVVGVRRLLQDERPGFALEPAFLTGLTLLADVGLPFDVCVRAHPTARGDRAGPPRTRSHLRARPPGQAPRRGRRRRVA